jgi:hypothetical protein
VWQRVVSHSPSYHRAGERRYAGRRHRGVTLGPFGQYALIMFGNILELRYDCLVAIGIPVAIVADGMATARPAVMGQSATKKPYS